jgi:5-methylcytosine-specific restriction endonuclease McrA
MSSTETFPGDDEPVEDPNEELGLNGIYEVDDQFFYIDRDGVRRDPDAEPGKRKPLHWSLRAKVANRDGWRCFYCEGDLSDGSGEFDHKRPVSRGGDDTAQNLAYCCHGCNQRKKTMTSAEFLDLMAEQHLRRAERNFE